MSQYSRQFLVALFFFASLIVTILTSHASEKAVTIIELENATYHGIEDVSITLSEGAWEGQPYEEGGASRPRVGLLRDKFFTGDLDGDGSGETAAILLQSGGGTGSYIHIAVMSRLNGDVSNIATALIGDRVEVRSGEISDESIILEILQAGDNDPLCCPTMLVERRWELVDGLLVELVPDSQ